MDSINSASSLNPRPIETRLEEFDTLFVGDPVDIERNLKSLLPQAQALTDRSIYLQILSQIALAQAMQKHFTEAHDTLDRAEKLLTAEYPLAKMRLLLERGRVFQQSGNPDAALPLYAQAYELGLQHPFDEHTINAAHMMHFVVKTAKEKIEWDELAIALAEKTHIPKGKAWLGPLYNNVGHAYLDDKQYEKALATFRKTLQLREQEGYAPNIRVAKWAVARALRHLGRNEEALPILLALVEEYTALVKSGTLDIPKQALPSMRGLVYEELAEIKGKQYAALAYDDLSQDEWMQKLYAERLERLKQLKEAK